jgi:CDP-diacylglycerol--glycerol-3-phosphate 3-phosphatidyltransferase
MNLANRLTLGRIALIIPLTFFLLSPAIKNNFWWAASVFVVACATDSLDGWVARKFNQVTDLGKFLDPIADKMLIVCALVCLVQLRMISSVPVIIVIMREFGVTSLRLLASSKSVVIAADAWGKAKTVVQVGCVLCLTIWAASRSLGDSSPPILGTVCSWLPWVMAGLTVVSGTNYVWRHQSLLR